MITEPLLLILILAAGAALCTRTNISHRLARAVVVALGLGIAVWATAAGAPTAITGTCLGAAIIGAVCLPRRGDQGAQYAVVAGVAAALAAVAAMRAPRAAEFFVDDTQIALLFAAGTAVSLGGGFILVSASISQRIRGGALWLCSAAVAVLALRRLCAYGPRQWVVDLPTVDAAGNPAFWLVDFGQGVAITHCVEGVAELGLVAATALLLASVPMIPARLRGAAGTLGGLGLLAVVGWLLTTNGAAAEVDSESVATFLKPIAVKGALENGPSSLGTAPFAAALHLVCVPIALLSATGAAALTAGLTTLLSPQRPATGTGFLAAAQNLELRDNLQWGSLALATGTALFLFQRYDVTGVWGPASPAEHLLSGATLAAGACAMGLHALGSRDGRGWGWVRAALVTIAAAVLCGAVAGGLVSTLGAFEL